MIRWIGRLFEVDDLSAIHSWEITFGAPWAQNYPALLFFAAVATVVVGVLYYLRYQQVSRRLGRGIMAGFRALLLLLLLLVLAEPMITMNLTERPRPLLLALFDGSDSMNIQDRLPDESVKALQAVIGDDAVKASDFSRLDLVRKVVGDAGQETLEQLSERARIRAYVMDQSDRVREIDLGGEGERDTVDGGRLASALNADGSVTALGNAIRDLERRHKGPLLAGVLLFSDFGKNAGSDPVAAARALGAPLFTVGVAPREVIDLALDLESPPVLKKDERSTVTVHVRQTGLTGQTARIALTARRLGSRSGSVGQSTALEASPARSVELQEGPFAVEFPFLPTVSGRYLLEATVEPFADEVLSDNNRVGREINVRDDSLKLFFVENEPSWEWRFVKEVFHRDPLIGREGFRTFLRSADFTVRRSNELFVENLVQPRAQFFDNDVVLLSDVPAEILSERFQELLEEYVRDFGGGLVVIAGPHHGLGALTQTRIADMLPVVAAPNSKPKASSFRLQLTPEAAETDFMNFGKDERENQVAWGNLGKLEWYQPVLRPHPLATVLATHPSDRCVDERQLQPIMATRRFGKGEVIYIGFNEMWRLRRMYGEQYYRQFWGQMIYRLGLGRALGSRKRFLVNTERPVYQAGDEVRVSVEAYSRNFESLNREQLSARLIAEDELTTDGPREAQVTIPRARGDFLFETTVPVYATGLHRLLVRDPDTGDEFETTFKVAPTSVERRNAARNVELQQALADRTGGKHYELHEWTRILDDLPAVQVEENSVHRFALWNTWAVLLLVLALMFGEWTTRKLMNLR